MLKDRVAIVTGGTRGIGYAIVKKFLENGARVVLCGSTDETAANAVNSLKDIDPDYDVEGLGLTLTDPEAVNKAFKEIGDKYGSIDILVNNAGISATAGIFEYDPDDFKNIIDLNVNAVFYCSQAAARIMKDQEGGAIINTSSMVSFYGQSTGSGYPTSKFALNGLTRSLARELGKHNIRVNAVAPGITNTDMVSSLPKEMIQPLIDTIPLGRMGEPEDIPNAFLFLASDMAGYITGAILAVDGAAMT